MVKNLNTLGIIVLLTLIGVVANASTVLVNNLDYVNASQSDPYIVSGPLGDGDYGLGEAREAVNFTVPVGAKDYYLNEVSVLAEYVSGNANDLQLALYASDGLSKKGVANGLPGTQLASLTLTLDTAYTDFKEYTANFENSIVLSAGKTYWATVESTDPKSDLLVAVQHGTTLGSKRYSMYSNMGAGTPSWMYMDQAGLKVTGSPVPEPSSFLIIFTGLAACVLIVRRKSLVSSN